MQGYTCSQTSQPSSDLHLNQNNLNAQCTPISKQKSAFKSPAPSNKKQQQLMKSPMITTQRHLFQQQVTGQPSSDKWAVSPVCTRLKEHIYMLNGNSQKERLLFQSPSANQMWLLASPAHEHARFANFHSTAPNTTTGSKYNQNATHESYSEMKTFHFVPESPSLIRKFENQADQSHFNNHQGIFNSTLKSIDKSDFKNNQVQNNGQQSMKDLVPVTMGIDMMGQDGMSIQIPRLDFSKHGQIHGFSQQDSNYLEKDVHNQQLPQQQKCLENSEFQKPTMISLPPSSQELSEGQSLPQKIHLGNYYKEQEYDQNDEESLRSDDEDQTTSRNDSQKENGKGASSRSYVVNSNGEYERIIRKRKRKSGDQIKILMREFDRNPNWSKETLLEVSRKTGLSEAQVYKWGWDQKRKKYGPEIAAQMMPPFGQFSDADLQYYNQEYNMELENNENNGSQFYQNQPNQSRSGRGNSNQVNPTPFPDSNLLDQLSSKLAMEESFVQNQYMLNQGTKNNGDNQSYQDDAHHDTKMPKHNSKKLQSSSNQEGGRSKKNTTKNTQVEQQSDHTSKTDSKNNLKLHLNKKQSQQEELISISLSQDSTTNKRISKAKDKAEAKAAKAEKKGDHNKENMRPLIVQISDTDRKTRSGLGQPTKEKDCQKIVSKKEEEGAASDSRKLRDQRVLRKHNLNK